MGIMEIIASIHVIHSVSTRHVTESTAVVCLVVVMEDNVFKVSLNELINIFFTNNAQICMKSKVFYDLCMILHFI